LIIALLLLALLTAMVGGVGPDMYNDALLEQLTTAGDFPICIGLCPIGAHPLEVLLIPSPLIWWLLCFFRNCSS
jgi:hypothetical protein